MERRTFFENVAKGVIASCYVLEGPEEYIKRSAPRNASVHVGTAASDCTRERHAAGACKGL